MYTLLIQSGKPVGVFKTSKSSPRVLIVNAQIVPKWAKNDLRDLEKVIGSLRTKTRASKKKEKEGELQG